MSHAARSGVRPAAWTATAIAGLVLGWTNLALSLLTVLLIVFVFGGFAWLAWLAS